MSVQPRRTGAPPQQDEIPYPPVDLGPPDAAAVATALAFAFDQLSQWLMANRDRLS